MTIRAQKIESGGLDRSVNISNFMYLLWLVVPSNGQIFRNIDVLNICCGVVDTQMEERFSDNEMYGRMYLHVCHRNTK